MVAAGNRAGTQFHVEKSQEAGLRILENFLRWAP
jgi:glutamine amidotransferase